MRMSCVLLAVSFLLSAVFAMEPSFDARDAVRQVRSGVRQASGVGRMAIDEGEFLIDTSITVRSAAFRQENAAIAFDGTNFLVAWADNRSGSAYDIYGARVSTDGVVLDPLGIAISTAAGDQVSPAPAFDGANFLVVWANDRGSVDWDIYGARVTPSGAVLDSGGFAISTAGNDEEWPVPAFDGTNFLVVWSDCRSSPETSDVYGARVTPGGVVLDSVGIAISVAAYDQKLPAVAFDSTGFLVVWEDYRSGSSYDVYGARVTPDGTVLDPEGMAISTAAAGQENPTIAFDGADFLVAWQDFRRGDTADIYGARVTPAGVVLDSVGIAISTAAAGQGHPAIACDGTNSLVSWLDERYRQYWFDIYGARVTSSGVVLDPEGIAISIAAPGQLNPTLAFDGTNFLVAWQEAIDYWDIRGARVTPGGVVLDSGGVAISGSADWRWRPAAAFNGENFLVVWRDERRDWYHTYGARVTPGGVVLDPRGIAISSSYAWIAPAVASDGANFLAIWPAQGGIRGARVTSDGVVIDTEEIVISTDADHQRPPAVAFGGTCYLAVWERYVTAEDFDIYGARVTPGGVVLDPEGIAISTAPTYKHSPAVAFDGANFLVVWEDARGGSYDVYGARVTPGGAVVDTWDIAISRATHAQRWPAIAFDGTNSLVCWSDGRNDPYLLDLYGARVTPGGVVLDAAGIALSVAANNQLDPAVAFDGATYLVTWTDECNGVDQRDIYGARVTPAGLVLRSGPVVRQEGIQQYSEQAHGPDGQTLLVYQGWAGTVGGRGYHADRIWGKMNADVCVEETANGERGTMKGGATVVRGELLLPLSPFTIHTSLFDRTGRRVMDLHPGANDVRHLASGVYFVREEPQASSHKLQAVRKVVIQR